jgi:hypothetical protein
MFKLCHGADPGFQARGAHLKKIATSGGKRENVWGILVLNRNPANIIKKENPLPPHFSEH